MSEEPAYEQIHSFGGVIDVLEAVGARYAIWGGLAVTAHGEPRFTQDMDVLLDPAGLPVAVFMRRLQESGYHVDEVAVRNALGGGFFNVIHLYYQVKTDFYVPCEAGLRQMIAERVYLPFDEARQAAYVTPAAAVISKLRAYLNSRSTRHLDDIASVIRVKADSLDAEALEVAAAQMGLVGVWRALWDENRP